MNKNKQLKLSHNIVGFVIVVFLAVREILGLILEKLPLADAPSVKILLGMVIFITACIVPVIVMENTLGLHPKLFKKVDGITCSGAVLYGYMLIIAASFVNALLIVVIKNFGLEFAPRVLTIPDRTLPAVLYFIYVCILPPVLEEIFTRGYMLNAFRPFGTRFAVFVSSLCFALLHSSLENFIVYFCCGVILAQLYLTFDSLLPAMALHCLNNSMSFFMFSFQNRANAQSALTLTIFIYVCVLIFGFAGKKLLENKGIYLSVCTVGKDFDMIKKLLYCRKAYMAVAAFGLLLFFAALGSYNSLI